MLLLHLLLGMLALVGLEHCVGKPVKRWKYNLRHVTHRNLSLWHNGFLDSCPAGLFDALVFNFKCKGLASRSEASRRWNPALTDCPDLDTYVTECDRMDRDTTAMCQMRWRLVDCDLYPHLRSFPFYTLFTNLSAIYFLSFLNSSSNSSSMWLSTFVSRSCGFWERISSHLLVRTGSGRCLRSEPPQPCRIFSQFGKMRKYYC